MFIPAVVRFLLIVFFTFLIFLCLFFSDVYFSGDSSPSDLPKKSQPLPEILSSSCPFYFGLSFFPVERKQSSSFKGKKPFANPLWMDNFLSREQVVLVLEDVKKLFLKEKLSLNRLLFVFPLALSKDEKWLISKKTFFILPTGERKELSHLSFSEIVQEAKNNAIAQENRPLSWQDVFPLLPSPASFLFYLEGSDREKMIRNIKSLKESIKGTVYISSSNELFLREMSKENEGEILILHSFRAFLRLQMLSLFRKSFGKLQGQGLIVPSAFSLFPYGLKPLRDRNQILFLEKDPPYHVHQEIIENIQALISSHPERAWKFIRNKKPCFIEN